MKPSITLIAVVVLLAGAVRAQPDAMGLYFSSTTYTLSTASAMNAPGFALAAYIVLTNPSGAMISGYEVGIACTAPDFAIPLTSLTFLDNNAGTNLNQIVTFGSPKPAVAGGTVLAAVFLTTGSTDLETISFGASSPSRLPGASPVVDYGAGGLAACSQPFGSPVVAWLNGLPVRDEPSTWGEVKANFR